MDDEDPTFRIPHRPTRLYRRHSGLEYEGETVFTVRPDDGFDDESLTTLVESILNRPPYRYGDWFDLPMPLYLVHDDASGDTFRVSVRDGTVELHVLPETESDGLRAFYDRLTEISECRWTVTCRSS